MSGRRQEAATRELTVPAPTCHLLSSMAVYTAWGDTEKNRSSRSSQVSSVSCRTDGPRGQPTLGSCPGCPCHPCWGQPQEPKALGSNVASGSMRLFNRFQEHEALRYRYPLECLLLTYTSYSTHLHCP